MINNFNYFKNSSFFKNLENSLHGEKRFIPIHFNHLIINDFHLKIIYFFKIVTNSLCLRFKKLCIANYHENQYLF